MGGNYLPDLLSIYLQVHMPLKVYYAPTNEMNAWACIAQLECACCCNCQIVGSIPAYPTKKYWIEELFVLKQGYAL